MPKTFYSITKNLTANTTENILSCSFSNKELADSLENFFMDKTNNIRSQFRHKKIYNRPTRRCNILSNLETTTKYELLKIIKTMNSTSCNNDPCNTKLTLETSQTLVPVWTKMINQSLSQGILLQTGKRQ